MAQRYSKRLLSPYAGSVQVIETTRARALSIDGKNWAVQYSLPQQSAAGRGLAATDPDFRFSLVATLEDGLLKRRPVHTLLDPAAVESAIAQLVGAIREARVPFAPADRYEYWLLDGADETPLALLRSCVHADETALPPAEPAWIAMPAAQLEVSAPEAKKPHYVPPVNYRLQQLVDVRAGAKPRAAWFDRAAAATLDFPPCLLREDWRTEEQQQLCDRYIDRLAPRLLMLQDLPSAVRQRLERSARRHVFDVERFHPLYPQVVDPKLIAAARVEAQLRRSAEAATAV